MPEMCREFLAGSSWGLILKLHHFGFHGSIYFMEGCKTGHQSASLLRARAFQAHVGLRRADACSPDPVEWFCIHLHLFIKGATCSVEEMEVADGWTKGGNLAIAAGEVWQSPAAVRAEATREPTFVPTEAAAVTERGWCLPGISPPASAA